MSIKGVICICWSFILALMLTILPLPLWAAWARPECVLLVIIYWTIALPNRVSIGIAWLMGLLLDVISGTLLGEHALAMALVAYITISLHRRLRVYPLWQQASFVFALVFLYQLIIFILQGMIGQLPQTFLYWLPSLTSMLFWPWVFIVLRDWRRYYKMK